MIKLTNSQMQHYLSEGYVTVQTDFPPEFHHQIWQQIDKIFRYEGNPRNEIFPRVQNLGRVLIHPTVKGALTSILGPEYMIHPHRHCHLTEAQKPGQNNHQDSYEDDENVRHHRSRWAMAFYYPQDVDETRGPTAITPGSQYFISNDSVDPLDEIKLCGSAGTVTIVHYDLWHRATDNVCDEKRYMVKFLFCRMAEPQTPSWQTNPNGTHFNRHQTICSHLWNWHSGENSEHKKSDPVAISDYTNLLSSGSESGRLDAAYALGEMEAIEPLMEALHTEAETSRDANVIKKYANVSQLNAGMGLCIAGKSAIPVLINALHDQHWWIRAAAADILGDIGQPDPQVHSELSHLLNDESEWVRRNAVESLGVLKASEAVPDLSARLTDNSQRVCHNAALALARIGADARKSIPHLQKALKDENRYVRGLSGIAIDRITRRTP